MSENAEHPQVENRLLPLPKSVEYRAWKDVAPGHLRVVVSSEDATLRLAGEELAAFLSDLAGCFVEVSAVQGGRVEEGFDLVIDAEGGDLPSTGHQAYSMTPHERGLHLAGAEPIGAYYAVKTLKQAIQFSEGRFRIPMLRVSDGADLAERGFWDYFYPCPIRETSEMYTLRTRREWEAFLEGALGQNCRN